ncbi:MULTISPECIES: MCE family protein [unclassified Nocardioides]|uniref:MCE family protein n=1 Tax=unclassified Nocardioides TaxID=2615069 RepID=UPI0036212A68
MSGPHTGFRRSLLRVAIFAVVTVLMTALLARTIQGYQDDDAPTYAAVFTDATRLAPGDDVRLAGVSVGRVESVTLTDDARARVEFAVEESVRLGTRTSVVIRYRNLIGDRYLALSVPVPGGSPLEPGDTLPLERTRAALDLTAVFNGFKPLFAGLDSSSINALSLSLVKALQGEGGTIASLLDSTGSLGHAIGRRDRTIGTLVQDLSTVLTTLNRQTGPFNRLVTHLRDLTGGLARDRGQIVDALAGIDGLATATDTLLTRARPHLRGTVEGLRDSGRRLRQNRDKLAEKVELLPVKLNAIMRSAQYGSWFQFFNCGLGLEVHLPGDAPPVAVPPSGPSTEICGA